MTDERLNLRRELIEICEEVGAPLDLQRTVLERYCGLRPVRHVGAPEGVILPFKREKE